jgi:hypothetical protein
MDSRTREIPICPALWAGTFPPKRQGYNLRVPDDERQKDAALVEACRNGLTDTQELPSIE